MTYSIVARDARSGELGVASQSHYFALGRVVPFAQAGVGAVATQSFVEPNYGPAGLALMKAGSSAEDALKWLVSDDVDSQLRQVAMIDATGGIAAHTGVRCVPNLGEIAGDQFVVVGNMLASEQVVPAMAMAYRTATGDLAHRLLAAMDAGEAAGGDARGRMSAAMVVVGGDPAPDAWSERRIDVRVDDAEDPLAELRRLVALAQAHRVFDQAVFTPGLLSGGAPVKGSELAKALAALVDAGAVIGDDPEPSFWRGVLLARAGRAGEAQAILSAVVAQHASYSAFLDGLWDIGVMPVPAGEAVGRA